MNNRPGHTILHQLAQRGHRTQMMSFLIETENGHLIAIDGGNKQDTEYFHGYLQGLTGQRKPVIDLWIITHAHSDHTDVFYEMMRHYSDDFALKKLAFHFPPFSFMEKNEHWCASTITDMTELLPAIETKGTEIVTVQEGDVLTVDGVTFEILYTPDPAFTMNAANNSSIVTRMEASGQSVLFLGDLGIEAGNKVLHTCLPEKLRADFVQLAHHGQSGVTREFYEACVSHACLWCTPEWLWNNDAGNGYNTHTWQTILVRGWMEELGVKHHFIAKDGTNVINLPCSF